MENLKVTDSGWKARLVDLGRLVANGSAPPAQRTEAARTAASMLSKDGIDPENAKCLLQHAQALDDAAPPPRNVFDCFLSALYLSVLDADHNPDNPGNPGGSAGVFKFFYPLYILLAHHLGPLAIKGAVERMTRAHAADGRRENSELVTSKILGWEKVRAATWNHVGERLWLAREKETPTKRRRNADDTSSRATMFLDPVESVAGLVHQIESFLV